MLAQTFWKVVVADRTDFLDRLLDGLAAQDIRFCVLGGQGVKPTSIRSSALISTWSLRRISAKLSKIGCATTFT